VGSPPIAALEQATSGLTLYPSEILVGDFAGDSRFLGLLELPAGRGGIVQFPFGLVPDYFRHRGYRPDRKERQPE
jgi:hypothetical protein